MVSYIPVLTPLMANDNGQNAALNTLLPTRQSHLVYGVQGGAARNKKQVKCIYCNTIDQYSLLSSTIYQFLVICSNSARLKIKTFDARVVIAAPQRTLVYV